MYILVNFCDPQLLISLPAVSTLIDSLHSLASVYTVLVPYWRAEETALIPASCRGTVICHVFTEHIQAGWACVALRSRFCVQWHVQTGAALLKLVYIPGINSRRAVALPSTMSSPDDSKHLSVKNGLALRWRTCQNAKCCVIVLERRHKGVQGRGASGAEGRVSFSWVQKGTSRHTDINTDTESLLIEWERKYKICNGQNQVRSAFYVFYHHRRLLYKTHVQQPDIPIIILRSYVVQYIVEWFGPVKY